MSTKLGIIKILHALHVEKYKLRISFSDGKTQIIDFEPFLKNSVHPEIRKYLNLRKFKRFTVESGDLMWGDFDLIFPITDLYQNRLEQDEFRSAI